MPELPEVETVVLTTPCSDGSMPVEMEAALTRVTVGKTECDGVTKHLSSFCGFHFVGFILNDKFW